MGHGVTALQHINPRLSVCNDTGTKRLLDSLLRRNLPYNEAGMFQVILKRLPSQLKRIFKTLNNAFAFQIGKIISPLKSSPQQQKSAFKILETLPATARDSRTRPP